MSCDFCSVFTKCFSTGSTSKEAKLPGVQEELSDLPQGVVPIPPSPPSRDSKGKSFGPFETKAKQSPKYEAKFGVRENYRFGSVLGTGGFATVRQITDRKTGEPYACKIMALPGLGVEVPNTQNSREDVFKEIEILSRLDHQNIVSLKEFYHDDQSVYLVSELLQGGELLDAVLDQEDGYSEDIARSCFQQLMLGIQYLHSQDVAHRDLKLENLLLVTKGDISKIKITDFGLAKLTKGGEMSTIVGTPQYVAPEVIRGLPGLTYSVAVDMWSAGVILFILLGGYPPFYAKADAQLFDLIRNGEWNFDDPVWREVSNPAKLLISKLLVVDPEKRMTAEETLSDPWVKNTTPSASPLPLTHKKMLDTFSKWKKAYKLVTAVNKFKLAGAKSHKEEDNSQTE